MPRLNNFSIKIETGEMGITEPVKFSFNSHEMSFEKIEGDVTSRNTFMAESPSIDSYAHSMNLLGPQKGEWEVKSLAITYRVEDEEPYTINFAPLILNSKNQVNIWQERPLETFDV